MTLTRLRHNLTAAVLSSLLRLGLSVRVSSAMAVPRGLQCAAANNRRAGPAQGSSFSSHVRLGLAGVRVLSIIVLGRLNGTRSRHRGAPRRLGFGSIESRAALGLFISIAKAARLLQRPFSAHVGIISSSVPTAAAVLQPWLVTLAARVPTDHSPPVRYLLALLLPPLHLLLLLLRAASTTESLNQRARRPSAAVAAAAAASVSERLPPLPLNAAALVSSALDTSAYTL